MLPKRWIAGFAVVMLFLGSFFGFACDDDEDNGNGTDTETVEPADDTGDDTTPAE